MAPKRKEPTVQIVIISLFMLFIIGAIIIIYIFRVALFGPNGNTSAYGTYSELSVGACIVEGKSDATIRCTDVGTQVSIRRCIPNTVTGLGCWDGSAQTMASQITTSKCTPPCTSFAFTQTDVSPCLIKSFTSTIPREVSAYDSLNVKWCRDIKSGTRFRTYNCERRDGSGSNLCAFTCGNGNVYNADCLTSFPDFKNSNNGTTILYDPTLVPANNDLDFKLNGNTYIYAPIPKSAYGGFPVLASNIMVTKEPCTDFDGILCGNWEKSTIVNGVPVIDTTKNNNFTLTENCNVEAKISTASGIGYPIGNLPYNYNPAVNNIYDLFKPGIQERELTCFPYDSTSEARCNPEPPGCIKSVDIFSGAGSNNNILKLLGVTSPDQSQICGIPIKDDQNITIGVSKDVSILKPCIFTNSIFSSDPNTNLNASQSKPSINGAYWSLDGVNSIFGIPLFITKTAGTRDLYLSLFNTPCPDYNFRRDGSRNFFDFTGRGSFTSLITGIPFAGIPFTFDCKASTNGVIKSTPCSWVEDVKINPSSIFGVEQDCNIRTNNISPVIEQTALMLMIKPAEYSPFEILPPPNVLKCNIFAIFGGNYIGWLTTQNNFPGYAGGDSSGLTLTWSQGRFDSYGNSLSLPGARIESLPEAEFYIYKTTNTTFSLGVKIISSTTFSLATINVFDGFNSSVGPIGNFALKKATSGGLPLVDTNNVINDTTFSNFLYSRQNAGDDNRFPSCNIMISRN